MGRQPDPPARLGSRNTLAATFGRLLGAEGGAMWPEATVIVADVEVDPAAARRWLPGRLRLPSDPRATVFFADYPSTGFGIPYREVGVLLHGELGRKRRPVVHCPWIVVDDDSAMIFGRELLGFPKKLATIEVGWDADHGTCDGSVVRRGEKLLGVRGRVGPASSRADWGPAFPSPIVNVWGPPGPFPPLLLRMDPPQVVHRSHSAELEIEAPGGDHDPLHELAISNRPLPGRVMITDIGEPPAGRRGGGRDAVGLLRNAARPVGLVSPAWLARRYLFRSR